MEEYRVIKVQPRTAYEYFARVDGEPYDVEFIAKNDGLSLEDFKAWFNPVFDEEKEDRLTFPLFIFRRSDTKAMAKKRRNTGYYDCRGREIHEGDIVKVGNLEGAVTYDERLDLFFFGILPYEWMNTKTQEEIEIIGRIEKPEDYISVLH